MNEDEKRQILFMIDELEYRIDSLAGDIQNLKDTSTSTNDGTSTVALDNLQSAITTNRGNIALLRQSVNTNTDNIALIQTSISEINESLTLLENSLQTLQTNVLANGDSITKLQNGVSTNSKSITALQNSVANNSNSIKEMQSIAEKTNELTSGLGELQTQINVLETSVNSKQDALTAGDGIVINNGVVSANIDLSSKQDVLTAGNGITIENNVISSTGGTVSEELTNQVNENTTNISNLQGRVTTLEGQVAKYLTPPDPNYTGKSFTDYPAGTIIQTYDYDERKYNLTHKQMLTTPTLYFCAEQSSIAKITITSDVSLQTAGIIKIKTYLNDSQIDEQNFDILTDCTLQQISFDIYDVNLSEDTKANNIYTTLSYNNASGNTITLKYQKVEIVSSNIMFLNKLCPFDAFYFNGKYHLTDCSSGTIKIAEIEAENMHNMDNLTWIDTLIPAQECLSVGSYNIFSGGIIELNELYRVKRTLENKFFVGVIENNFQKKECYNVIELDYITQFHNFIYFVSKTNVTNGVGMPFYDPTKDYWGRTNARTDENLCIKLSGYRYYGTIAKTDLPLVNIKHNQNGECYLQDKMGSGTITTCKLADGNISSLIIKNYESTSKFDIRAYIHHYDKTIQYDISYNKNATEPFIINSAKEIGTYDKVFEMPNNYYFAVKNNQLNFYQFTDADFSE